MTRMNSVTSNSTGRKAIIKDKLGWGLTIAMAGAIGGAQKIPVALASKWLIGNGLDVAATKIAGA